MSFSEIIYNRLRKRILSFERIFSNIPGGHLLDLGCSYGTFAFLLHERMPGLRITGIDINCRKIRQARKRSRGMNNIEFLCRDVRDMKLKNKFNCITCIDIFHHVPRQSHGELVSRIYDLLRPGGVLILKDMNTRPYHKYLWNYIHDKIITRCEETYYTSAEDFRDALESHGFRIRAVEDLSNCLYAHYAIIGVKR